MFQLNPVFCTILFCASISATYFLVRAKLARVGSIFAVGVLVNSLFFFLFALSRDNSILQAVIVGFALGIVFTTLAVLTAAHFRDAVVTKAELQEAGLLPTHAAIQTVTFKAGR